MSNSSERPLRQYWGTGSSLLKTTNLETYKQIAPPPWTYMQVEFKEDNPKLKKEQAGVLRLGRFGSELKSLMTS